MDELSTNDWNETPATTSNYDPDPMASIFNSVISALLEVHIPLKHRRITSHHAPWIAAELKNLMKERDLAKKKPENDAFYWSEYKKSRKKITFELCKRVQEYYHNLVDETQNNPKATLKTINKVLHKNSNHMVTQSTAFEGTELKSSLQISESFNKHFTTVGSKLAEKIISQPSENLLKYLGNEINDTKFNLHTVSGGHVECTVRALNDSKSPGADSEVARFVTCSFSLASA